MKRVSSLFLAFALQTCGTALVASLVGACGHSADAKSADTQSSLKAPGEAQIGDTTMCPISKEKFTVTASSPKAEYKGKTYYFCCAGCDAKFKADPEKYVAPQGS